MRPSPRMSVDVVHQRSRRLEPSVTLGTFVRSFVWVRLHVSGEQISLGAGVVAVCTHELGSNAVVVGVAGEQLLWHRQHAQHSLHLAIDVHQLLLHVVFLLQKFKKKTIFFLYILVTSRRNKDLNFRTLLQIQIHCNGYCCSLGPKWKQFEDYSVYTVFNRIKCLCMVRDSTGYPGEEYNQLPFVYCI